MITAAVTREEGGEWIAFPASGVGGSVHSIVFDNGAVWDAVNGWRQKPRREALPRIRVKMGRAVV